MEILFALLYAFFIGLYNIFKKFAVKKSLDSVVLVLFTTVAFVLSLIWIPFGLSVPLKFVGIMALKGFLIAFSWFLILKVMKTADLTLVVVTGVLSTVLSFVAGIVLFKEVASVWQIVGSVVIILGVAAINWLSGNKNEGKGIKWWQVVLLVISALISAFSTIVDKYTSAYMTSYQVQFWFLLFAMVFSWILFSAECIRKKQFLIKKNDLKNFWVYLAGIVLFVADLLLFKAYQVPGSEMITITVLMSLKVIVAVVAGITIFKEKNIWLKLLLTLLVVGGAVLISLF